MRKIFFTLPAAVLILTGTVCSFAADAESDAVQIQTVVAEIDQFGNLDLEVSVIDALTKGFEIGDIAAVKINDTEYDIPVVSSYNDVDPGSLLCRLADTPDKTDDKATLAINMGNLADWAALAKREDTEEKPGYRWTLNEGIPDPIPVVLTLKDKGGYDEQLKFHQLVRSDSREDYPELDDAAYANFREIDTTGMGRHILYRSSSPVDPKINRNREADAASAKAGIKTFINMADSENTMRSYDGFDETYYSTQQVICLNMVLDFQSEQFRKSLAEGFSFIADNEGPFLIHCTEGKDRAGFASAVLEAFMGADADEIYRDYMTTYYNYYGIEPGSEMYEKIIDSNIRKTLLAAFGLETLEGADLQHAAEEYLKQTGLTEETIAGLREKLAG